MAISGSPVKFPGIKVRAASQAASRAASAPSGVGIVTMGIAEILSEDMGREINYVDLPAEQFKQAMVAAGAR